MTTQQCPYCGFLDGHFANCPVVKEAEKMLLPTHIRATREQIDQEFVPDEDELIERLNKLIPKPTR